MHPRLLHSESTSFLCRTAIEVEDLVESLNAVPATIGILDGKVHIGMPYICKVSHWLLYCRVVF